MCLIFLDTSYACIEVISLYFRKNPAKAGFFVKITILACACFF